MSHRSSSLRGCRPPLGAVNRSVAKMADTIWQRKNCVQEPVRTLCREESAVDNHVVLIRRLALQRWLSEHVQNTPSLLDTGVLISSVPPGIASVRAEDKIAHSFLVQAQRRSQVTTLHSSEAKQSCINEAEYKKLLPEFPESTILKAMSGRLNSFCCRMEAVKDPVDHHGGEVIELDRPLCKCSLVRKSTDCVSDSQHLLSEQWQCLSEGGPVLCKEEKYGRPARSDDVLSVAGEIARCLNVFYHDLLPHWKQQEDVIVVPCKYTVDWRWSRRCITTTLGELFVQLREDFSLRMVARRRKTFGSGRRTGPSSIAGTKEVPDRLPTFRSNISRTRTFGAGSMCTPAAWTDSCWDNSVFSVFRRDLSVILKGYATGVAAWLAGHDLSASCFSCHLFVEAHAPEPGNLDWEQLSTVSGDVLFHRVR